MIYGMLVNGLEKKPILSINIFGTLCTPTLHHPALLIGAGGSLPTDAVRFTDVLAHLLGRLFFRSVLQLLLLVQIIHYPFYHSPIFPELHPLALEMYLVR